MMASTRATRSKTRSKLSSTVSELVDSPSSASSVSTDPRRADRTPASESTVDVVSADSHETKDKFKALEPPLLDHLPHEIRRMIWEATFVSRQIPITRESALLHKKFDPPFKHITESTRSAAIGSPIGPEYTSFLTCPEITSPAALGVHRESRQFALAKYRPWKMFNKKLRVRNIMWCPALDVVSLLQAMTHIVGFDHVPFIPPLPIFEKQFPAETEEIKNLVVPSTMWDAGKHDSINVIWPLIDFVSLEELIVFLDKDKERELADKSVAIYRGPIGPWWTVPEDIDRHVVDLRSHYEKFGPEYMPLRKKPIVTVIDKEEEIHRDQSLHVLLRCEPCKYLDE